METNKFDIENNLLRHSPLTHSLTPHFIAYNHIHICTVSYHSGRDHNELGHAARVGVHMLYIVRLEGKGVGLAW